jgi:hypothetical protein
MDNIDNKGAIQDLIVSLAYAAVRWHEHFAEQLSIIFDKDIVKSLSKDELGKLDAVLTPFDLLPGSDLTKTEIKEIQQEMKEDAAQLKPVFLKLLGISEKDARFYISDLGGNLDNFLLAALRFRLRELENAAKNSNS